MKSLFTSLRQAVWTAGVVCLAFCCSCPLTGQTIREMIRDKIKEGIKAKIQSRIGTMKPPEVDALEESLLVDGRTRTFLVHPPKGWDGKTPVPLLLLFHGGGGSGRQALATYGLIEVSDREGFLLVAPNGNGKMKDLLLTWNVYYGFGYAQEQNVDDIGFVKELVKHLREHYPIDPSRIFATGISNGGALCYWVAASPDHPFAAIAPIVAPFGGRDQRESTMKVPSKPTHPIPVLMICGALDKSVPIEGGVQKKSANRQYKILTSASETIRFWAEANRCDPKPERIDDPERQATGYRYFSSTQEPLVEFWLLHNQGHAWPGGKSPRQGADQPSPVFDANAEMWRFFKAHPRQFVAPVPSSE